MRLDNFIALIVSSLIILSGCQTNSLSKPNEVLPNSTIEGEYSQTYTYRLDNGLQIILWPNSNSHSQNEARLDLLIHAGSLHEEDDQLYPQDPLQLLSINLECDPAQVDKVLATIDQSLNELVKEGISQKDINQEVNMLRGDYGNHRHKANYIIWELVNAQLLDIDPSTLLDAKAAYPNIKAATLDAMLAAFVNNHHSRTIAVLNP